MTTPSEKLRYIKCYGTIVFADGKWTFRADPQKKCEIRELTHESKWVIVDMVYDNLRGIRVW